MNDIDKLTPKSEQASLFAKILTLLRLPSLSKRRSRYKLMLQKESIGERFDEIYEKRLWSSKESRSGTGSELNYTQPLRDWLVKKVADLNVQVFVDAPCGDFNWMKEVVPKAAFNYVGLDIVASVIENNKKMYSSSRVSFSAANICEDTLPQCDLIMVRDCLFHLSYENINSFLKNLSNTDYKYLLTTTHIVESGFVNKNITTGDFRRIDLFASPFFFDKNHVLDRVNDYPKGYKVPREMVLIEKKYVPTSIHQDVLSKIAE